MRRVGGERDWACIIGHTETATHKGEEVRRQGWECLDKPGPELAEPKEYSDANMLGPCQAGEQSKLERITCARGQYKLGFNSQVGNPRSR